MHLFLGDRKSKTIDSTTLLQSPKISVLQASPAAIAETNWKFVAQLLKECKAKTKRILLEKLGQEAVEWGHGEIQFSGEKYSLILKKLWKQLLGTAAMLIMFTSSKIEHHLAKSCWETSSD